MATETYAIAPGQMLGQYEVITPITSGGMASVYLGRHAGPAGFARHVAIKVVHPRFADDPQFVAMFLDEARLSSRIEHANVVRVEALGNEQGLYYLVMEHIRGVSLQAFVRQLAEKKRALVPSLVVHIVAAIADALHAAHETADEHGRQLGIVHRDVSPQNVLLSYAGAIKLIDFGIAKAAGRSHHTTKGALKGKLRYMAPEQAEGKTVDGRTDVYALGIVLWEMLTYRKLFSAASDAELIYKVRNPQIIPPSRLAPQVSPALDAVVMQALAAAPEARHQTALAFRRALFEACPEARGIDAQDLSVLVRSTMVEELARDARMMPSGAVSLPDAMVAAREEVAMTRIVQGASLFEPDDSSEGSSPLMPPMPAPGTLDRPPSSISAASMARPSLASPEYGIAATRGPSELRASVPTPMMVARFAEPRASAPPDVSPSRISQSGSARSPSFTPGSPPLRNEVMAQASLTPAAPRSRVGMVLLAVLAVVITIALGGLGGWYALHQAHHMMTP